MQSGGADLRGARLVGADLRNTRLARCRLDGAEFNEAQLEITTEAPGSLLLVWTSQSR